MSLVAGSRIDRVFLDSNVLFSASYRTDAPIRRFWLLPHSHLLTSVYVVDEARRNAESEQQRIDLEALLAHMEIVEHDLQFDDPRIPDLGLPPKDQPVMLAAIDHGATHLVTGDWKHFSHLFHRRIHGVLVLPTADYP